MANAINFSFEQGWNTLSELEQTQKEPKEDTEKGWEEEAPPSGWDNIPCPAEPEENEIGLRRESEIGPAEGEKQDTIHSDLSPEKELLSILKEDSEERLVKWLKAEMEPNAFSRDVMALNFLALQLLEMYQNHWVNTCEKKFYSYLKKEYLSKRSCELFKLFPFLFENIQNISSNIFFRNL